MEWDEQPEQIYLENTEIAKENSAITLFVGVSSNGRIMVSNTINQGSSPCAPAIY